MKRPYIVFHLVASISLVFAAAPPLRTSCSTRTRRRSANGNTRPTSTRGYPDRVYFGDTHLHTSYSTDAGMLGTRLGPKRPIGSRAARRSRRTPASVRACNGRSTSSWCPITPRISALRR